MELRVMQLRVHAGAMHARSTQVRSRSMDATACNKAGQAVPERECGGCRREADCACVKLCRRCTYWHIVRDSSVRQARNQQREH